MWITTIENLAHALGYELALVPTGSIPKYRRPVQPVIQPVVRRYNPVSTVTIIVSADASEQTNQPPARGLMAAAGVEPH